jgi:uncharacterized protein
MSSNRLPLTLEPGNLAICKMDPRERTPGWVLDMEGPVVCVMRTHDELCIVCSEPDVPRTATAVEKGFRAFRITGTIPHAVSGVLSSLTGPLAEAGISVFSLFTYDTNYLLVKSADVDKACKALERAGFPITQAAQATA